MQERIRCKMKTPDEIRANFPSICYSCDRARRVASETNEQLGFVGCSLRVTPMMERVSEADINEAKIIAEGWVDLRSRPFGSHSGVISNYQIVTLEVEMCGAYQ